MNTSLRQVPLDSTHLYEIWSFNGGAPGPFIRARQGDVLDISFTNNDESGMWHNIDFHAVSGPGGGAGVLTAEKDETRSASFKLLYPGLFIYHCAVHPVAHHVANGMYGMILVEPEEGLPKVDREFAVVQSEFYTNDEPDEPGSRVLSLNDDRLMDENPNYVVFNGRVGSMTNDDGQPLLAKAGERVRIFFGNAGPNLVSSFHVIGAIFDKVYREGDLITPPARGLQTTLVPAGGASVVELVPTTPGTLTLVDHSIVRIEKGCVGFLNVEGPVCPTVFHSDKEARPCRPCKIHP
jgi:copper-containing nitrite reductase